MSCSKSKSPNFSGTEQKLLMELVFKYREIVEAKKTDTDTNNIKKKVWQVIETEFNSNSMNAHRTKEVLKRKYENVKKRSKVKFTVRTSEFDSDINEMELNNGGLPDDDAFTDESLCEETSNEVAKNTKIAAANTSEEKKFIHWYKPSIEQLRTPKSQCLKTTHKSYEKDVLTKKLRMWTEEKVKKTKIAKELAIEEKMLVLKERKERLAQEKEKHTLYMEQAKEKHQLYIEEHHFKMAQMKEKHDLEMKLLKKTPNLNINE